MPCGTAICGRGQRLRVAEKRRQIIRAFAVAAVLRLSGRTLFFPPDDVCRRFFCARPVGRIGFPYPPDPCFTILEGVSNEKSIREGCFFSLEAPPRIELGNKGFADLCLTAWLWCRIQFICFVFVCNHALSAKLTGFAGCPRRRIVEMRARRFASFLLALGESLRCKQSAGLFPPCYPALPLGYGAV